MSDKIIDRTVGYREAQEAADKFIGDYTWTQLAALPPDLTPVLRLMWIYGYMAGKKEPTP